ncbi:MAG: glycine zipper domain-containing protein [Methylococcaceae bacterium]
MKKLLFPVFCSVLVSSCATQSQQTKTEGTAIGCATGAIIGGLAGWAISGNATGAAIGAGAGGLTGCAGGYLYADNLDNRRKELAGKENDLDAQIKYVTDVGNDTQQYNQDLKSKIADFDRKVSELQSEAGSQESARKELEHEINAERQQSQQASAKLQKALNTSKAFRSTQGKQSAELDTEIKKLENDLEQLQKNSNALASLSQRI